MEQHHHMLAPASRRETLPPPPLSSSHIADLGPPPPPPRFHPNAASVLPPAYSQASPPLQFPDVPTTDLPFPRPRPTSHNDGDKTLPSLSSLTSGPPLRSDTSLNQSHWPVLKPIKSYHSPSQGPLPKMESPDTMELDTSSNSIVSATSPDRFLEPRASSVSLDDPDVRLAAEALGDLRADFVSSPPNSSIMLPLSPAANNFQHSSQSQPQQPEPLLSLLTTSHPLLATTIGSATSAYGGAKNFSPRFKSSAEYVEGYLTPIANTVGSVGRVTGVEGGVRWFLGAGRRGNSSSDLESGSSKKRRKVHNNAEVLNGQIARDDAVEAAVGQPQIMDTVMLQDSVPPTPKGDRRLSMASTVDTLPAYDELRSPAYTESTASQKPTGQGSAAWQSRLIMSTSGLSVAMSDESLRSLKYCLSWLRWANGHMAGVIGALKTTLEEYDRTADSGVQEYPDEKNAMDVAVQSVEQNPNQSRTQLAARIDSLKGDVLKTLQDVINTVSKYAGGALPENARVLVRRHLTSLPQRFRIATMSDSASQTDGKDGESAMRDGAHKILVLAKEGLDMVTQVSGVLDGTIVSAEEWCDRMGKKRTNKEGGQEQILPQTEPNGDVKMG